MNNIFKKACIVAISTTLFVGTIPETAFAQIQTGQKVLSSGEKSQTMMNKEIETTKEGSSNSEKEEYRKNEAVVMYYNQMDEGANKIASFGSDTKIEKTWDFSGDLLGTVTTNDKSLAGKVLTVSKVTSKKLSTEQLIQKLKKNKAVLYAEPNYILHAASNQEKAKYSEYQWGLDNEGQNAGIKDSDINPESIWEKTMGTEKVIAVVDSGIDYNHEDLKENIWNNPYTKQLKGAHGYDFMYNDADPMDDYGHGTHCAGIIAGNGKGVSGVTTKAKLMALKFLDEVGDGELEGAIAAYQYINHAIDLGVNVVAINNSWVGGSENSNILHKLVEVVGKKGAITVNAAGNSVFGGDNVDSGGMGVWDIPSDYRISVAASDEKDQLAEFSNYGKESVDLAAPGTNILSTVSENSYNPTIHSKDKDYSELFIDFNGDFDYSQIVKYKSSKDGTFSIKEQNDNNFGLSDKKEGCMCITVDAKKAGEYGFYIPIYLPKSSTKYNMSMVSKLDLTSKEKNGDWGIGCTYGVSKISEVGNQSFEAVDTANKKSVRAMSDFNTDWEMDSWEVNLTSASPDKDCVFFEIEAMYPGEYKIYIDNFGFSKKNMKQEELEKYQFMSGTSMAAPFVTGAIALLSETYPDLNTKDLRNLVVNSVRKKDSMKDKVVSGGVLDLSKVEESKPYLKSVITKKDTIEIKGSFFGTEKGEVFANGKPAEVKEWSNSSITIAANELHNKKVEFQVKNATGKSNDKEFYTDYSDVPIDKISEIEDVYGGTTVSDGDSLYYLDGNDRLLQYKDNEWKEKEALSNQVIDPDDEVGIQEMIGCYPEQESQLVYDDNNLYIIVSVDMGYCCSKALVRYDIEQDKWERVLDLTAELSNIKQNTLAIYDNNLYIIGGFDTLNEKVVGSIYTVNYKEEKPTLTKSEQTMPNRFAALSQVVNKKLIVTLGGDGTDECPANIMFDGKQWTVDKENKIITNDKLKYYYGAKNGITYYTSPIGQYDGKIIYGGLVSENLGDVFAYDVQKNQYETLLCSVYSYKKDAATFAGTVLGDKFVLIKTIFIMVNDGLGNWYMDVSPGEVRSFELNDLVR